jgi:uncharacterized alpha-E superfamily protein
MSNTMLSRVADHLYWMGRYIERTEHTARVLNVQTHLALEESQANRAKRVRHVLSALRQPELAVGSFEEAAVVLTLDAQNPASVRSCIRMARENARQIRERIASEMWEQVNRLHLHVSDHERSKDLLDQPHEFYNGVLIGTHLFNGVTDSTMSHDQGWQFIQVGRWLERAGLLVSLLDTFLRVETTNTYLDWLGLLKCCTAYEAYRKKVGSELDPVRVGDFLILSETFPHSLRFAVTELRRSLQNLAQETENRKTRELDRVLGKMHHDLEYGRAEEVVSGDMSAYFERFRQDLMRVHTLVYKLYIAWEVEF